MEIKNNFEVIQYGNTIFDKLDAEFVTENLTTLLLNHSRAPLLPTYLEFIELFSTTKCSFILKRGIRFVVSINKFLSIQIGSNTNLQPECLNIFKKAFSAIQAWICLSFIDLKSDEDFMDSFAELINVCFKFEVIYRRSMNIMLSLIS